MSTTIQPREDSYIPPKQWSESHDLMHYMVPYDHFTYDPWDILNQLREWLQAQPETHATWTWEDAATDSNYGCQPRWDTMCRLLGAWPLNQKNSGATTWINPYYGQLAELEWQPDEHKATHILRSGVVGTQTITTVASRFDNYKNAVYDMCQHRNVQWGELRRYGKRRVANTVVVTTTWSDRSIAECARALDMPPRTLRGWIEKYATVDATLERPDNKTFAHKW